MVRALPWLLPLLIAAAVLEVVAHFRLRAGIPSDADYAAATGFIRAHMAADDALGAAPDYVDPLLRQSLGDRIDLAMAGRSDLSAYGGLWGLSVGDARPADAPATAPDQRARFGPLWVRHWTLPAPSRIYDFTAHALQAEVRLVRDGASTVDCPLRRSGPPRGGGLGKGVLPPAQRFECPRPGRHQFVAPVVVEDLELQPRYCIWQHPRQDGIVRATFREVPLGEQLVLYAGLYYEHERMRDGPDVRVRVHIDGTQRGELVHRDGDGWQRLVLATGGGRGDVSVDVLTDGSDHRRGLCWAASTRRAGTGRQAPQQELP